MGEVEELAARSFQPCSAETPRLEGAALADFHERLGGGWQLVEQHHLEKLYRFEDFAQALDFVNDVGDLAEALDHHPDIRLSWGRVVVTIWTHVVDGLSEGDFVFAAKLDRRHAALSD